MSDQPEPSLRDTIRSAIASGQRTERPAAPPRPPPPEPPPAPEPSAPKDVSPSDPGTPPEPEHEAPRERPEGRPRDQFGRFLSSSSSPEPTQEAEKVTEPEAPEPHTDQPETPKDEPETPAIAPPASWSATARDNWRSIPRVIQDEILRREGDIQRGLQDRAEQINQLQPFAQVMEPYRQKLALRGIHPAAAVQQLLAVQDLLDRDPLEGVAYVARSYGVDLRQFATMVANQPQQDPLQRELAERLARLEQGRQQDAQNAQQQEMARIQTEVTAFAANSAAHPYFEQVRPMMAQLMQSGMAATLDAAYAMACRMDDTVQQRRDAEARAERNKAERELADKAKRAAVSISSNAPAVRHRPNGAADGSVRNDVREAIRQVASR